MNSTLQASTATAPGVNAFWRRRFSLDGTGYRPRYWASWEARAIMALPQFVPHVGRPEICFAATTPRLLGFAETPRVDEWLTEGHLSERGMHLCRLEDGPYIREAYVAQPFDEKLSVGMKPVGIFQYRFAVVFRLENPSRHGLELNVTWHLNPHQLIDLDSMWIFRTSQ